MQRLFNIHLFRQMRAIADMIFEYAETDPGLRTARPWLEDRRQEGVNPYYRQTESGLFLELYYGQPGSIWSPWGKWGMAGSGSGDWTSLPEILRRLGASERIPLKVNDQGEFGPTYSLHEFDGVALPEPKLLLFSDDFADYDTVKKAWARMIREASRLNNGAKNNK